MRRALVPVLLALTLLGACQTPVHADDGVTGGEPAVEYPQGPVQVQAEQAWSGTICWSRGPIWGSWWGHTGYGAFYASIYASPGASMFNPQAGKQIPFNWVGGVIHFQFTRIYGAECYFGFPIGEMSRFNSPDPNRAYWMQLFYLPGTCSLKYIVALDNGTAGGFVKKRHFCTNVD